jgi:hypothetical protein
MNNICGIKIIKSKCGLLLKIGALLLAVSGAAQVEAQAPVPLPNLDQLVQAKLEALRAKLNDQKILSTQAELNLSEAQIVEKRTFDTNAYLSLAIFNSAPPSEYRLEKTEIFLDNHAQAISLGGPLNQGLPRNNEQIYFSTVTPGCHELIVKATYVRLKNTVISQFQNINRQEIVTKKQAFIAKDGYRINIEIEGFEAQNSLVKLFRSLDIRFNKSVSPNFLPGAPLGSLDGVLKQGLVQINYRNGDPGYYLLKKSVSIDGLPIISNETHDQKRDDARIFSAPLAEGTHKLNVTLLFAPHQRVGGGPTYNFRLSFDRDFAVLNAQTSVITVVGLPENGFRGDGKDSRYARVTSSILSQEDLSVFPATSCKEIKQE